MRVLQILVACLVACSLLVETEAKLKGRECEVCVKATQAFIDHKKANKLKKLPDIENSMRDLCSTFNDPREKRFCFYIGGQDISATGMLRTLSEPMKNSFPAEKICEILKSKDAQICDLVYEKELDLNTFDYQKASVKELKNILAKWNEKCAKGECINKEDYVKKIKELRPKHDKTYKPEL